MSSRAEGGMQFVSQDQRQHQGLICPRRRSGTRSMAAADLADRSSAPPLTSTLGSSRTRMRTPF